MAGRGKNFGQDFTVQAGPRTQTNTSQYRWVCGQGDATSQKPAIPNTDVMNRYPVGIIQNFMQSGTVGMSIRTVGVSAVKCGAAVTAFKWVKLLSGGLGTITDAAEAITAATIATNTLAGQTAAAGFNGIVGMPLEDGVTNQTVEMIIRPFVAGLSLS